MTARPPFTIDIKRGSQVLSFGCSFLPKEDVEKDGKLKIVFKLTCWAALFIVIFKVEDFQLDEFSIHQGDWNENVYTADCTIIDGVGFDLFDSKLNV